MGQLFLLSGNLRAVANTRCISVAGRNTTPLNRRTPLERFDTRLQQAHIRREDLFAQVRPQSERLILRARGNDREVSARLQRAYGLSLPLDPNTVSGVDAPVFWMGPGKWMIVNDCHETERFRERVKSVLHDVVCIVSDCSDVHTVIRVSGRNARALIARGCSLDLHPKHFAPGHCAQSLIARIPVLLHQIDDLPSFDLYVDTSFSVYFWHWLQDASSEYSTTTDARLALGDEQ